MGSHDDALAERAAPLGRWIAEQGCHLLTGAGGGVMMAVSRAFAEVEHRDGLVIGVVPATATADDPQRPPPSGYPNPWVELPIYTHLGAGGEDGEDLASRNHINILTSTVVVLLPGAAGTRSEARLAVRYETPCVAFLMSRVEILGLPEAVPSVSTLDAVTDFVRVSISDRSRVV